MHTSQQAIPLAMMNVPCQSTLRGSARHLWFSTFAEVREPHFCRLISISDAITMKRRNKVQLVWELSAKKIDDHTCEYSNHIHASAIDEFITFIEKNGVTFEQARAARQQASDSHNLEETPNFANSIERRSLSRD
jgi:hypothetical protein